MRQNGLKIAENMEKGLTGRLNVSRWSGIIDISGESKAL